MVDQVQRHLLVQYAVTRALAEATSLADAAPRVLRGIGDALELDVGILWIVDPETEPPVLTAQASWARDRGTGAEFAAASSQRTFLRGAGVVGGVWASGQAEWLVDIQTADGFLQRDLAERAGLASIFAFPVIRNGLVDGVVAMFAQAPLPVDRPLMEMSTSIGTQIGQFIERTQAEQAVRDREARHRAILEAALDCIITIDDRGLIREFNPAAERTFGYAARDIIGREMADLIIPPHLREAHRNGMARYLATGAETVLGHRIEIEAMRADGSIIPIELAISRVNQSGPAMFTAYLREISDRLASQQLLLDAEERYRTLLERLPAIVYEAEAGGSGAWNFVSPQIQAILGFSVEEWLADPEMWARQLHPEDREAVIAADEAVLARPIYQTLVSEYRAIAKDGRVVWLRDEMVAVPVEEGRPTQIRGVIVDITERKELEERLRQHAFYDTLTGLPNRVLFMERLEHALTRVERASARTLAVMFLDVDDFKVINDTLGHAAGDNVLAAIGERLGSVARRIDTPARFGGDEFTLLLEDLEGPDDILAVADRLADRLAEPFRIGGHDLTLSASLGIAVADGPSSAEELVRHADMAMYRAKENGKARYEIYHDQLNTAAWRRLELEGELRRAIARDELLVHYQPVIDLATGATTEVEALVRWQHPERGLLSPAEFVPFAESTGQIVAIDRFVLLEACRQLIAWDAAEPERAGSLSVGVNLSAREFRADGIVETVAETLRQTRLAPHRLKIEITESVTLLNGDVTDEILRGLAALGVRLVIDDFGVGYSGLDYVKRFDVDALKIDRSFVAGLGVRREDTAIVSATIAFARALDLSITAEGIETAEQLRALEELGCERGQGYLFSPAVPADEVERAFLRGPAIAATGGRGSSAA